MAAGLLQRRKNKARGLLVLAAAGLLLAAGPALAQAGACRTPDGFYLAPGGGIGADRQDIGIYGRITGFGSICVNGLEIEYGRDTPVSGADGALKIGQVVAVLAHRQDDRYIAKKITVSHAVTGAVSRVSRGRGEITVQRQKVLIKTVDDAVFDSLKKGAVVAVSGLRQTGGAIVAGSLEILPAGAAAHKNAGHGLFGGPVGAFSVQGFVEDIGRGRIELADGPGIALPENMAARAAPGDQVIVFGRVGADGAYVAEIVTTEQAVFPSILHVAAEPDGADAHERPPEALPEGSDIPAAPPEVPELPGAPEIVDIPAPVEIPDIPAPVEIPDIPVPVDIPDIPLPVEIPDIPLPVDIPEPPPVLPDLPLLPGG